MTIQLAPSGTATINVNKALARVATDSRTDLTKFSDHGSAALKFKETLPAISGFVSVVNASASLSYVSPFQARAEGLSAHRTLEGLWWRHDSGVGGFLNLSNSTSGEVSIGAQPISSSGKEDAVLSFPLSPHESKLIDLDSLLGGFRESTSGGLRVTFSGRIGDVNVSGGLENAIEGYSAAMPFWLVISVADAAARKLNRINHPGLMVGSPDPDMNFPADTRFLPYLALRNTRTQKTSVHLTLFLENGEKRSGPIEILRPLESKQIDMKAALERAGLSAFNGKVTLEASHAGFTTDIVEAAGSVDNAATYVLSVEGKSSESSASKTVSYWTTKDGETPSYRCGTRATLKKMSFQTSILLTDLVLSGSRFV